MYRQKVLLVYNVDERKEACTILYSTIASFWSLLSCKVEQREEDAK